MSGLALFPHQRATVNDVHACLDAGRTWRPAIVAPTGSGKTIMFSALSAEHLAARALGRVVILVDTDELVAQTVKQVGQVAPHLTPGVIKAERNDVDSSVIVASIQTLARTHRLEQLDRVSLVIVDECHGAVAPSYIRVLTHLGCMDETVRTPVAGFTATLIRGDGKKLGDVWQTVIKCKDLLWFIRKGYLADPVGISCVVEDLDLSAVRKTAGDYNEGDTGKAIMASAAPEVVAAEYKRQVGDLPGIGFAPTVETAHAFSDAFNEIGIVSAVIWGAMPLAERRQAVLDYDAGRIQVLWSCMALTKGFDSPRAAVAIMARPTSSPGLYIQMAGRVLRTFAGNPRLGLPAKDRAYIFDVVGVSAKHALATIATLAGEAGVKAKAGRSFLELDELKEEGEEGESDTRWTDGPLVVSMVDLFHGSREQWLQTRAGFWFIPSGKRFIMLRPSLEPGCHDVLWWNPETRKGGILDKGVDSIDAAKMLAEADITDDEAHLAKRSSRWRKGAVSGAQLAVLRRYGVNDANPDPALRYDTTFITKGEAANVISYVKGSSELDSRTLKWLAQNGMDWTVPPLEPVEVPT